MVSGFMIAITASLAIPRSLVGKVEQDTVGEAFG
jgi:hypothetical protein